MCAFSLGTETDGSIIYPADRNAVVGIKSTVGSVSCDGLIPEASSLDAVGTIGRTVEDAPLALDAIKGNLQQGEDLRAVIEMIKSAGAEIHEATDFPSAKEIISPTGWNCTLREHAPEDNPDLSEFTVVKTEFYNDIRTYLSNLAANPNEIKSLEDIVAYNKKNADKEGGFPGKHPCWPMGQDNFEKSVKSKGAMDDTYHRALEYIRKKSREEGIDAALSWKGSKLDGLLVPVQAERGVASQVAAKAGMEFPSPLVVNQVPETLR
ncbi:predicted protein [Uncinocarpus reesii 1704]|uniref:Amidase domain-containing protein n=1 Tax=Uncinocarpus reesii (strain UAMH 1704) TaxID=336963 RepID=C4JXK3_UNCRE|nr:uncharacterized protein UREG_06376 [Uncinocarpus reesii 1704]EEP81511.1 predicted protein [Uncinocarpus reesii 1704]